MPVPGKTIFDDAPLNALMASLKNQGADQVIWKDMGLELFIKNMKVLDRTTIHVGIVSPRADDQDADGRLTLGQLAQILEFGSRSAGIPPRHFVKGSITPHQANEEAEKIVSAVTDLEDPDSAMVKAGKRFAERIRDRIYSGGFTANAAATIRKKGFDHPLVESSLLADAVGYQLVRDDDGVDLPFDSDV